jgi:hypothetical protein
MRLSEEKLDLQSKLDFGMNKPAGASDEATSLALDLKMTREELAQVGAARIELMKAHTQLQKTIDDLKIAVSIKRNVYWWLRTIRGVDDGTGRDWMWEIAAWLHRTENDVVECVLEHLRAVADLEQHTGCQGSGATTRRHDKDSTRAASAQPPQRT